MNEDKREALRREFSALLDNELDAETRATVEAELAEDADALRELEALKRLDALYRALPRHTAPDDFEARVHAALENNVVPFSRFQGVMRWVVPTLAAAMVFIVVGTLYFSDSLQVGQRFQMTQAPAKPKAADAETRIENEKNAAKKSLASGKDVTVGKETDSGTEPENLLKAKRDMSGVVSEQPMSRDESAADTKMPQEAQKESTHSLAQAEGNVSPAEVASTIPESPAPSSLPSPILGAPAPMADNAPAPEMAISATPVISLNDKNMPEKKQEEASELKPGSPVEKLMTAESAAGSAAMKDHDDDAPARQLQSTESPIAYFRMLREHRAQTADLREKQKKEAPREVAGRVFTLEQSVWVEATYRDEEPEYLELGSDAYETLAKAHPELREMVKLGAFVLVGIDGLWHFVYRLDSTEQPNE